MGHLTLSLFGPFEAALGGQPIVHFRSSKVQGLLIYLVMIPDQVHSREALAALFWPEDSEKVAKHNLRQSLFRLRKLLGETDAQNLPFLLANRSTLQFNSASSYALDVATFLTHIENNRLELAVQLYGGDLLPDFSCDSLPFDDWLRNKREKLHRQALNVLFDLTDQQLKQGDFANAQRFAQQQLTLEPWREEAHRQLIQALALAGERSAALAQYERCRTVLAEELGVEPATETKQLISHIQRTTIMPTAQVKETKSAIQQLTIPFSGRQTEYEALTRAYQRTGSDGLQLVTVSGKAGIGKTRLVEQYLSWVAMQGMDLLVGRSFETSTGLSYQPLINLFRQRLDRENAPEDLLSDFWLSQLTRLLPELRDRYPDLPSPTQDESFAKQHLFEAITRLGQALAERQPIMLFIDDWHWADSASLDLLQYAVVRWAEAKLPILLLLTLRQEAITPEIHSWVTRLTHTVSTTALHLGELSQQETVRLLQMLLNSQQQDAEPNLVQFCEWLFAETQGQPLFLAETLKALAADGLLAPATAGAGWQIDWTALDKQGVRNRALSGVQTVIRGWLNRISDGARQVLTAVSVLEQESSFDHLRNVAGFEEMETITALDELFNRQMLLELAQEQLPSAHEPIYSFAHQMIRDVVYSEAGAARRRMLHRRAFETLQASAAPAAELAHHAQRTGLIAETIHFSLIAGNEALAMLAAQVAIHHYQTAFQMAAQKGWPDAISDADRQELFRGLGQSYELSDKAELAQGVYEELVDYARQIEAPVTECMGLNRLASLYNKALLNPSKAFAVLDQAWRVAKQAGDRRGMAETAVNLSSAAQNAHDQADMKRYAQKALTLARELDHPQLLAHCLRRMAYLHAMLREWELGEQAAIEAQQRFEALGNFFLANDIQRVVGGCQIQNGRTRESLETLNQAYAFVQRVESKWEQADAARFLAQTHTELGHYGQALRLAKASVELTRKIEHPFVAIPLMIYSHAHLAILSLDVAQEILQDIFVKGEHYPFPDEILSKLCVIHAMKGEWTLAHTHAKQVVAFHVDGDLLPMGWQGWFVTEALLRGGDSELARAEVARIANIIGTNRRYRLPLLRSQAVLAKWDGDIEQAIMHLETALGLAQEMELPGEEWPIWGELGKLYAEQGEAAKSHEAYQKAAVIIQRLANTIDDEDLREGFVTAVSTRTILNNAS